MVMNITNVLNGREVLHFRALRSFTGDMMKVDRNSVLLGFFCFAAQIYCGIYILHFQSDIKYKIQKRKKTANYLHKSKQK